MIAPARWPAVLACAVALSTAIAHAELLAYEGFVYEVTNRINGLNGGVGWRMPWNEGAARFRVLAPTLASAGVASFGNAIEGVNAAADQTAWRRFYGRNGADYIGGAYSTNWFSVMLQHRGEAQMYGGSTGCVVILAATDASYGTNRLWYIGAQPQFTNSLGQYSWGFRSQGATVVRASEHAVVSGETVHIVVRMAQGATSTALAMWINPAVTNEPALGSAVVGVTNMTMQWSVVIPSYGYASVARCAYDELRVGDTWADMTNMPLTADKPVNQLPVNGAGQMPQPVTLQGSAFSSALPGDTLAASQFALISLDGASTSVIADTSTSANVAGLLQNTRYNWQVRYKGALSGSWGPWSDATWFDTAGAAAGLLAYDGAAYAATGSVAGAAGGHGWLGGWVADTATATNLLAPAGVSSPGLYYGNIASTGNTFATENPLALRSVGARRQLARDGAASLLNTNGLFGRAGTTNWFSLIVTSPDSSVGGYGLSARPKLSDSLDRLFFGKSRFARAWQVATWGGSGSKSFDAGADAQPVFLVCRVVHGLGSNDTAALGWVNPDPAVTPDPATAAVAVANTVDYDFGILRIGADTANAGEIAPLAYLDEVRVGASYDAVAPTLAIPNQPVNQTPTAGEVTGFSVILQGSAFSSSVPGDLHTASDFEVLLGTQTVLSTNVPGAVTALLLPAGLLQSDVRYTWRLRYYGNAMPSAWSAGTYFEVQNTNAPRLVVYDGAVYAATNSIRGLQGGSGWQGAWTALAGEGTSALSKIAVAADGLTYDSMLVNGGRFVADTTLRTADAARGLDGNHCAHLTSAAGAWGRPGTTNWLAYLARNDSGFGGYRVHLNTSAAALNYFQSVCSFGTAFSSPQWTLAVAGQTATAATPDPLANVTRWLVARLVFGLTPDSSSAHVWIDPPLGSEPDPAAATLALSAVSNFVYTAAGMYAAPAVGSNAAPIVSLDELKIGETWDVLADVPEPAGLLLLLPFIARCVRPRASA